ncbi:hypothetical protein AYO21_11216 [Fonsecaea monophora]|uniref:Uncharacterized protein n=1 Tax=Fonsecaea monophora TaxID=254056 RepID=A0A177ETI9_9EURO|nr:hypothetical protein AYO21_11216 [Fonsecaea monophora]OAG34620.1 hypothetical protein AYO21_11216 [Fonsecaea monophora]
MLHHVIRSPFPATSPILLLLLLVQISSATLLTAFSRREPDVILPRGIMKNGTCDEGYEWTVITPLSTQGATCCPVGYKGEEAKILGNLVGTFCCPEHIDTVPCDAHDREMPTTPLTCPEPGQLIGALCMYYYW